MKAYLSKYALSEGIEEVDVRDIDEDGAVTYLKPQGYIDWYTLGRDIHETRDEAEAAAEKMRVKKIASLKKQVAKLEAMTFGGAK